jgi:response regulator RpfG family c-di-GMP phosphodiesterase
MSHPATPGVMQRPAPSGPRVLCVDDEAVVLRVMTRLLEGVGATVTATSGPLEALAAFAADRFDLIVTDVRMPRMDGHAFLAEVRALDPEVPVIVATGHASLESAIRALREGATGMLMKPFTGQEFLAEIRAALERSRIRHDALQYRFVTPILDGVALALTAAIEARDLETGEHCRQLGWMGERVASLMGFDEELRTTIRIGGYLHDVGKIAIADRILLKPGKLTDDEYREMQRHAEIGGDIVSTHAAMTGIATIVRHHHERWDGAGYPDRLRGDVVPVGARIIAIADALSAMTNDRPYRGATSLDAAWAEILRNAGTQFDPGVVEVYESIIGTDIVPAPPGTAGTSIAIVGRTPVRAAQDHRDPTGRPAAASVAPMTGDGSSAGSSRSADRRPAEEPSPAGSRSSR